MKFVNRLLAQDIEDLIKSFLLEDEQLDFFMIFTYKTELLIVAEVIHHDIDNPDNQIKTEERYVLQDFDVLSEPENLNIQKIYLDFMISKFGEEYESIYRASEDCSE